MLPLTLAFALGACGSDPVCAPGASVACVGAGGCMGGQVCNAAGSGFGACACGTPIVDGGPVDMFVAPDASEPDLGTPDGGPPVPCNVVTQAPCAASERCAWVSDAFDPVAGALFCVPSGPAVEGGACTVDASNHDDCGRGLACINSACERVCDLADPAAVCGPGTCVAHRELGSVAGTCIDTCDPVTQLRSDGTACGAGHSCFDQVLYGVCMPVTSVLMQGDLITGPPTPDACAAGFTPANPSADGVTWVCVALCRPVETSSSAPAGAAGLAPYTCPARGAGSPANECLFQAYFWAGTPNTVGVCFDRTGLMDPFHPGRPWPSCTTLANTDTDGDGLADNLQYGCAPPL